MRPKRYLSLWYIWRKPFTYLALTLTPSPNGPSDIPNDPHHLGVPSGASKTISEPMVRRAQTVHRSCFKIRTISKRNETSFHLSFVTTEYHRVRSKRYLSLWYIWRKPCTYVALTLTPYPNGPNEVPHDPCHLGVPSDASKMIFEPMLRSAQTMHLSCTNTNTISKWTERDFT